VVSTPIGGGKKQNEESYSYIVTPKTGPQPFFPSLLLVGPYFFCGRKQGAAKNLLLIGHPVVSGLGTGGIFGPLAKAIQGKGRGKA